MENLRKVLTLVTSAGIVQGCFLTLLTLRKGSKGSDRALALIIAFFTVYIAVPVLYFSSLGPSLHPYFLFMGAFPLTLGPLLLFYVRRLEAEMDGAKGKTWGWSDGLHTIPLVAYLAGLAYLWSHRDALPAALTASMPHIVRLSWAAILVHAAAYLIRVIALLHGLSARLKERVSSIDKYRFSWLRVFAVSILAAYAAIALFLLAWAHGYPLLPVDKAVSIVLAVLVYALGWRGFLQKGMPVTGPVDLDATNDGDAGAASAGSGAARPPSRESAKYARSGMDAERAEARLSALRAYMDEEKPYLDPELSLPALAGEAGMQTGELSRVVNEAAGMNFYDFVNSYRVEEAKRLLLDPAQAERSVLDIAFGSGFRSKSTFNQCFKKFTGSTPQSLRQNGPSA